MAKTTHSSARSSPQSRRFPHLINADKAFGTHRDFFEEPGRRERPSPATVTMCFPTLVIVLRFRGMAAIAATLQRTQEQKWRTQSGELYVQNGVAMSETMRLCPKTARLCPNGPGAPGQFGIVEPSADGLRTNAIP
jgi:hypothetical protein